MKTNRSLTPANSFVRVLSRLALGLAMALAAGLSAHAQNAVYGNLTQIGSNLNCPAGVAVDSSGNLYIVDEGGNCFGGSNQQSTLFKETLQANGTYMQSIIPTSVSVYHYGFLGVAVDSNGNVFVADEENSRVLEESPSGGTYTEHTIGSGFIGPSAVTVDSNNNVYIADYNTPGIYKETLSGGNYTQTTIISGTSNVQFPTGVAVDLGGNVYVADARSNVSVWTLSGGVYTKGTLPTFITTNASVSVLVDSAGNLYVTGGGGFQKFTRINNTWYPGIGAAGAGSPGVYMAIDGQGSVYLSGGQFPATNGSILKFSTPVVNDSVPLNGSAVMPPVTFTFDSTGGQGVNVSVNTLGSTGLDFADTGTGTCNTNGTAHSYSKGDQCTVIPVFTPSAPGYQTGSVELFNTSGPLVASATIKAVGEGPFLTFGYASPIIVDHTNLASPVGVAVDGGGDVFVSNSAIGNSSVFKDTAIGGGAYAQNTVAYSQIYFTKVNGISGVALDSSGDLFFADSSNNRIIEESLQSGYSPSNNGPIGTGLNDPKGVAVDGTGNVYIADTGNNRIVEDTLIGNNVTASYSYGQQVLINSGLVGPTGIAVDTAGAIYIADTGNNRVLVEAPYPYTAVPNLGAPEQPPVSGTYLQSVVATGLNAPQGVYPDGSGNVYIADTGNNRVLKYTNSGGYLGTYTQSVVPVSGTALSAPTSVAVDRFGDVYIVDSGNSRVVQVPVNTSAPMLNFATTAVGSTSSDSPQIVTIENVGNTYSFQPSLIFPIPASGTNPQLSTMNFSLSTTGGSACPQLTTSSGSAASLAPNASCTLALSFTPQQSGSLSGGLTLTDNNFNITGATQTITLSGTATSGSLSISPTSLTFGPTAQGSISATQTATITNTTSQAIYLSSGSLTDSTDFTQSDNCSGLVAANTGTCTVTFTFTPKSIGALSSTYSIHDLNNPLAPLTVSLLGLAMSGGTGVITLSPSAVTFTTTPGVAAPSQSVMLTNTGTAQVNLGTSPLSITGTNASVFQAVGGSCGYTLAVGASCNASVSFLSTTAGTYTATFTVTYSSSGITGASASVPLTGTVASSAGVGVITLSPSAVAFTTTAGVAAPSQSVTLTNTGTAQVNLGTSPISVTGTNASVFQASGGTCGYTLAAGASCNASVSFLSTTTGTYTATFTVTYFSAGTTVASASVPLTGTVSATVTAPTDFSVASPTPALRVNPGGTASFPLNVAPIGGNFNSPVKMSVTGLPEGATASFAPPTVTPGTGTAPTVLTVQTSEQLAAVRMPRTRSLPLAAFALGIVPLWAVLRRRRRVLPWLAAVLLLAATANLSGCDGGYFGPAPKAFTLTVTGSSGGTQHSTTVTLTVN